MGAWGNLPWENDGAADWFGDLIDKTNLAKRVEDTLKLDPANSHEETRAAASVLLFLGRGYIWPNRDLERHLSLAADRLDEVSRVSVIAESWELIEEIRTEVQELRSRIKMPGMPKLAESPRKWWWFWN